MASQPWDPNSNSFPTMDELPAIEGAPKYAAWFWGRDDFVGRLNLLTPQRVKAAASAIETGEIARMDLPLDVPKLPAFQRQPFEHQIKPLIPNIAYDDVYSLNTQASTQWDGYRHASHIASGYFYNFTKGADIDGERPNEKCSIHYWSEKGFAGRGVLLDFRAWSIAQGQKQDSASSHRITYAELKAVGESQGIDIRPASQGGDIQIGDILFVRAGFTEDYYSRSTDENAQIALREFAFQGADDKIQAWVGLGQEESIIRWLHDCYFSAVAGDSPTFEAFPPPSHEEGLHGYLLALWGMPLGEMLDLEKVAALAQKNKKYFFFFTSAPANVVRGVSSHVNGTAIF